MLRTLLCFSFYVLVMLFGATLSFGQGSDLPNRGADLASRQLQNVQIKAQSVETLFTNLSLSYCIPIGLEIASHDDEFAMYELDLKEGTLTDLLNQFAKKHDQYGWEINDGVVSIFPKHNYRDFGLDELLKVQISKFSVKENTSCWRLVETLINTAEVQNIIKTYRMTQSGLNFSGAYFPQLGRNFRLAVSDQPLKTILNTVVRQSPVAKIWVIKKYRTDQTFRITLNARNEELPKSTLNVFQ
jgi:hypothetical protein